MRKIRIAIACLYCLIFDAMTLQAQNIESVELCDGSILEGYISEQYPGKSLTFSACRATIIIPNRLVSSIIDHKMEYVSLSADWKSWADEFAKGKNEIILSDIHWIDELNNKKEGADSTANIKGMAGCLNESPCKVRVLEKGVIIKYLDLTPRTYQLNWSDVKYVRRPQRSNLLLSGLNDVITLKESNDVYTGEIVEQILGKQIRLLKQDNMVEVINSDQIASIRREKVNPKQDIFEQASLLDQVYTQTGDCITGIILEQNYVNTKEKKAFLTILTKDGNTRNVAYSNVKKYGRYINSNSKFLFDVILNDTTVMLNRQEVRYTCFEQDEKDFLYAKNLNNVVMLKKDLLEEKQFVLLEMKDTNANDYALIRAVERKEKKKDSLKIGFTYENFAIYSTRPIEQTVSVNGTRRMKFIINDQGWYVLYLPKQKEGILFCVE